jgi:glycerol uptake facilitator-like aquaporin
MNIIRAVAYICSQLCGALLGAFVVQELVPEHMKAVGVLEDSKSVVLNNNATLSRLARALNMNKTVKSILTTLPTSATSRASTVAVLTSEAISNNATGIIKVNTITEPYKLGLTLLNKNLTLSQGVGVEIIITFILMMTVFACLDTHRKDLGGSFPLTIGFAVAIGCFFGVSN